MAFRGSLRNSYLAVKVAALLLSACCLPRQCCREIAIIMLVGPGPPLLLAVECAVACQCRSDLPSWAEISQR